MPHKLGRASGWRTLPWLTGVPTRTCPAWLGRCSVLWPLLTAGPVVAAGHNSDGKFIARAQRIEYDCELVPRRVAIFIEKTKDGQILPVPNVVVRDVACGANHTVRLERFWPFFGFQGVTSVETLGFAKPGTDPGPLDIPPSSRASHPQLSRGVILP